jgi:hypothetical protein
VASRARSSPWATTPTRTGENVAECYDPSWSRFKERTRPSPGNHEYETAGASGYFDYFGIAAGDPDKGYYSYDLGSWHMVALNSNCGEGEIRCGPGSTQVQWLEEDLAANGSSSPWRARALVTPEAPGATEPLVEGRRGAY